MKKHIYAAAILCNTLPLATQAQTYKGGFLSGANLGTASLTFRSDYGNYGNIFLSSSAGYFAANNLAVGLHFKYINLIKYIKLTGLRYHHLCDILHTRKKDGKEHDFCIFGELTAGIRSTNETEKYGVYSYSSSEYFRGGGLGFAYFFNPHVSMWKQVLISTRENEAI